MKKLNLVKMILPYILGGVGGFAATEYIGYYNAFCSAAV